MASSQSLRVAEVPRRKIVINVTSALVECAAIRDLDPSSYLLELFRADLASVRLVKLQQSRQSNFVDRRPPPRVSSNVQIHKPQKMDAEEVQRIVFLRQEERLSIDALAERFGRSATRIATVLRNFNEGQHVCVPSSSHTRSDTPFGNFCLNEKSALPRRTKVVS
jgi:hypothetical protein